MTKELLTIKEVCEATSLGRTYVYSLLKSGELKAFKVGRRTLVRKEDIDNWASQLSTYPSLTGVSDAGC